jgi:hypothetical protein
MSRRGLAQHSLYSWSNVLEKYGRGVCASTAASLQSSERDIVHLPQTALASAFSFRLSDGQDQGAAGSTAGTAKIARVPARSVNLHAGRAGGRDYRRRDHGLQLLAARGQGAQRRSVDDHDR